MSTMFTDDADLAPTTSTATKPRKVQKRRKISTKLGILIAVPLITLFCTEGVNGVLALRAGERSKTEVSLARAADDAGGVVTKLIAERSAALAGPVPDATKADTDTAIAALRAGVATQATEARQAFAAPLAGLDQLAGLRAVQFSAPGGDTRIIDGYRRLVVSLTNPNEEFAARISSPTLRNGVEILAASLRQREARSRLGYTAVAAAASPAADAALRSSLSSELSDVQEADAALAARDERWFNNKVVPVVTGAAAKAQDAVVGQLLAGDHPAPTAVQAAFAGAAGYDGLEATVTKILRDRGNDIQTHATAHIRRVVAVPLFILALGWFLQRRASKSISDPLEDLRRQADDLAKNKLPASVTAVLDTPRGEDVRLPELTPIAVTTNDEISDVAAALNQVQASALEQAVEQAVLRRNVADSLVHLGRRNQNLLDRQLSFISELEHDESDADGLAKLFRLDHLATRMRRNAESLLVLAGDSPPRTWTAPVPVSDVVRAALGEVEDYTRVTLRSLEPAAVDGPSAADLAHLLAELVENALSFSPPGEPVEVRGRKARNGYAVSVVDHGIGMTPEDIDQANRRLAGEESFTVAPSRYLGHHVTGGLAARHGISVSLAANPGGGVAATVLLPTAILGGAEGPSHAVPAEPARRPAAPAPAPAAPTAPALRPAGLRPERAAAPTGEQRPRPPAPQQPAARPPVPREPSARPAAPAQAPAAPAAAQQRPAGERPARPTAPLAAPTPSARTLSGLARRVPGAQRPDQPIQTVQTRGPRPAAARPPMAPPASPPAAHGDAPAPSSKAKAVSSMFGSFQSGVARAKETSTDDEGAPSSRGGRS